MTIKQYLPLYLRLVKPVGYIIELCQNQFITESVTPTISVGGTLMTRKTNTQHSIRQAA